MNSQAGHEPVARPGARKYPLPSVGDEFGCIRVLTLFWKYLRGKNHLRAEIQCTCGRVSETYAFNLRKHGGVCGHGRKWITKERRGDMNKAIGQGYKARGAQAKRMSEGAIEASIRACCFDTGRPRPEWMNNSELLPKRPPVNKAK